jgi:predicted GIY-YIG superfamily endonuclease
MKNINILMKKPNNYWTKERCKDVALLCQTKTEFINKYSGAYDASLNNKWLNEICTHMKILGSRYKRCIYVYEFSDNSAYIGLTYNLKERQKDRNNKLNDAVTKYINETGIQPFRKQLTEYIDVEEAIKLEGFYVEKYRNEGWNILNRSKTGSIGGGNLKWTFEACQKEALKYKTKSEFIKNNGSAYSSSKNNDWLKYFFENI